MKRFFQIVCDDICDEDDREEFEVKCSCAVACGYVPVNGSFQVIPNISGSGDSDDFHISTRTKQAFVQTFCDQDGTATMICAHCRNCENCQEVPESDIYCEDFEDSSYAEEE